ncbi:MAG: hypothetical protein QG622_456 [Actinomycetota bacterium]|nr:hypothetical protein [Actinomycetota bacterium]
MTTAPPAGPGRTTGTRVSTTSGPPALTTTRLTSGTPMSGPPVRSEPRSGGSTTSTEQSRSTPGVRAVQVRGGQVLLRLAADSASLVSATPAAGHRVQTWESPGMIRVDFSAESTVSSVFVTWNGHAPDVRTVEY